MKFANGFLCVFCLAAELEFVQIIIIIVVMTVMVVVIICLLNHYRLSAWSFLTRHSQARQREEGMQPVSVCVCFILSGCSFDSPVNMCVLSVCALSGCRVPVLLFDHHVCDFVSVFIWDSAMCVPASGSLCRYTCTSALCSY